MTVQGHALDFDPATTRLERPLPNTYWVEPGRLLAGEYPGALLRSDAQVRLGRLLEAGVDTFIDLTEPDELPGYEDLLSAAGARYRRFPVTDHGVPEDAAYVTEILDYLDSALQAGSRIYLHCRAGVGRTGTVIGCYLIRRGLQGDAALDRLARLWRQSERSQVLPLVPETWEQTEYVRSWAGAVAVNPLRYSDHAERIEGLLRGMALGEAAATRSAGRWGSDTAQTLLLAMSLLEKGSHDPDDQMRRYLLWQRTGKPQDVDFNVDVPSEVRRALATWQWTRKPYAGSHDPRNLDAHSLARTAAVALYFRSEPAAAIETAAEASRTTSQSPVVLDLCRVLAAMLLTALADGEKEQILDLSGKPAAALWNGRPLKPEIQAIVRGEAVSSPRRALTGTAPGVFSTALTIFREAESLDAGLRRISAAGTPPSTGAIYGALAGAYDPAGLPADGRLKLREQILLDDVARRLAAMLRPGVGG